MPLYSHIIYRLVNIQLFNNFHITIKIQTLQVDIENLQYQAQQIYIYNEKIYVIHQRQYTIYSIPSQTQEIVKVDSLILSSCQDNQNNIYLLLQNGHILNIIDQYQYIIQDFGNYYKEDLLESFQLIQNELLLAIGNKIFHVYLQDDSTFILSHDNGNQKITSKILKIIKQQSNNTIICQNTIIFYNDNNDDTQYTDLKIKKIIDNIIQTVDNEFFMINCENQELIKLNIQSLQQQYGFTEQDVLSLDGAVRGTFGGYTVAVDNIQQILIIKRTKQ